MSFQAPVAGAHITKDLPHITKDFQRIREYASLAPICAWLPNSSRNSESQGQRNIEFNGTERKTMVEKIVALYRAIHWDKSAGVKVFVAEVKQYCRKHETVLQK